MRIGLVIGASRSEGTRLADSLAQGASGDSAVVHAVRTEGLAVSARQIELGTADLGAEQPLLHDGGLPGLPESGGRVPECGVTVTADPRSASAVVARDRIGTRPFHLARTEEGLILGASQLAGLASRPDVAEILLLPPGHIASLGPDEFRISPGTGSQAALPEPAGSRRTETDLEGTCAELRAALIRAVRVRVPDEDYAVLLSGGLDSSAVLTLARRVNPRVRAVTVASEGSEDLEYARRLTGDLGVPLDVVPAATETELLGQLNEMVDRVETWESQVLTHSFPTWTALSSLSGRTRVVLTGEGSDELFGGYRSSGESESEVERHRLRELGNLHRTSCQRLDRLAAAAGVDVRSPFLDTEVVRIALRLPAGVLVDGGLTKAPLRKALSGDLPEYVLKRPKMTFARGAGYRYGSQAAGEGLLADRLTDAPLVPEAHRSLFARLARGRVEQHSLRRFVERHYDKAGYLLSGTL